MVSWLAPGGATPVALRHPSVEPRSCVCQGHFKHIPRFAARMVSRGAYATPLAGPSPVIRRNPQCALRPPARGAARPDNAARHSRSRPRTTRRPRRSPCVSVTTVRWPEWKPSWNAITTQSLRPAETVSQGRVREQGAEAPAVAIRDEQRQPRLMLRIEAARRHRGQGSSRSA